MLENNKPLVAGYAVPSGAMSFKGQVDVIEEACQKNDLELTCIFKGHRAGTVSEMKELKRTILSNPDIKCLLIAFPDPFATIEIENLIDVLHVDKDDGQVQVYRVGEDSCIIPINHRYALWKGNYLEIQPEYYKVI